MASNRNSSGDYRPVVAIDGLTRANVALPISNRARSYALFILVIVYTLNFVDRQILAILLPSIKAEFGASDTVLGFLAGPAFAIFYTTLGLPIAILADRFNRRNLIAIAVALWSVMTALSGMAANIVQLSLARIGVGIGEAGCQPAAYSMIADYYPPSQRSTALGIYTTGITFGIMLAYIGGGWVVENIGWRQAFYIVGLPGVLLALVVWLTVKEPPRGLSDGRRDTGERPPMLQVAKYLAKRPTFIHLAMGSGLAAFAGYVGIIFFPSFLVRSHGLGVGEIGLKLGLIYGIAGGIGFALGGYVADKLGKVNRQRSFWGVAAALMVGWLFSFPVYLVTDINWVFILYIVPVLFSNFYLATTLAQVQSLVGLRMRAVASAMLLLILNLIGLALGPQVAGILSDTLSTSYGADSMRYTLLIITAVTAPWAAWHYFMAAKTIDADLARVDES